MQQPMTAKAVGMNPQMLWGIGGLILGILLGMLFSGSDISPRYERQPVTDEELRAAAQELFPDFYGMLGVEGMEGEEISVAVQGRVEEVRGDRIVIAQQNVPKLLRLIENIPDLQEVTLGDGAVLVRKTQKDDAVYMQEIAAYERAVLAYEAQLAALPEGAEFPEAPVYPEYYLEEPIELSVLEPGDLVTVSTQPSARKTSSFATSRMELIVSPLGDTTGTEEAPAEEIPLASPDETEVGI